MTPTKSNSAEWSALVFALVFPTVLTWVYFIALAGSDPWLQKGACGIGKVIQFAFPLVFVLLVRKERLQFRGLDTSGLVLAIGFPITTFSLISNFLATDQIVVSVGPYKL